MRRVSDERGVVAVVVALVTLVMMGMAALAIDVGMLYQEKRELQNGADAGALAVAEDCARGVITCSVGAAQAVAQGYADLNANDLQSDAVVDTTDFDPNGRASVIATTRDAATSEPYLTLLFARVFGVDTATVDARATAIWGSPSSLGSFPLIVSTCEYDQLTAGGTAFAEAPYDDGAPAGEAESELVFHDGNPTGGCAAQAGHDLDGDGALPGGFGWLVSDGYCRVVTTTIDGQDWVSKDSGNNRSGGCDAAPLAAIVGTVVAVPVFEDFCRPAHDASCPTYDNKDKYRVARYAAFYVSGFDLGGPAFHKSDGVYRTSTPTCGTNSQDDFCITGFFTTEVISAGDLGGPAGSVIVIKMAQ